MVWDLMRSDPAQEDEALKVLQKFCRKKYRQSLANVLHTAGEAEFVSENVHSVSGESNESTTPTTDAVSYIKCNNTNGEAAGGKRPTLNDIIKTILNQPTKSSSNPITRLWYKIEFTFGRGIKYVLLLSVLIAYALLGGFLVHQFEAPAEREHIAQLDQKSVERHRIYVKKISNLLTSPHCWSALSDSSEKSSAQIICNRTIELILEEYDELVGINAYRQNLWRWTDYWNAVFYCGTIFTTIGYGNMWCRTIKGRIFTILYALLGVPYMLVVLSAFGELVLQCVCRVWHIIRKPFKYLGKFLLRSRTREYRVSKQQTEQRQTRERTNKDDNDKFQEQQGIIEEEDAYDATFPIYGALLIIIFYVAFCSFIFRIWEHWDYFTAFYFFFISLTTVGLGDEMPNHPHYACLFFIFFIVGLSLVSMCVSIVQFEFEGRFMKALNVIDDITKEALKQNTKAFLANTLISHTNSVPVVNPRAIIPTFAPRNGERRLTLSPDDFPFLLGAVMIRTGTRLSNRQKQELSSARL